MSKNMSDNDEGVWPPPIHHVEEAEDQPLLAPAELTPQEKILVAGRWLFTVAVAWNFSAFIWEAVDHILHMHHVFHWWHLISAVVLLPYAIKSWRLRFKR